MLYSIAGTLNSILIFASLLGIWSQVKKVWERKKSTECGETPAELFSLNQFTVSFLAYWSFSSMDTPFTRLIISSFGRA